MDDVRVRATGRSVELPKAGSIDKDPGGQYFRNLCPFHHIGMRSGVLEGPDAEQSVHWDNRLVYIDSIAGPLPQIAEQMLTCPEHCGFSDWVLNWPSYDAQRECCRVIAQAGCAGIGIL